MAANKTRKPAEQKTADPDLNNLEPSGDREDVREKRQDPRNAEETGKMGKQSSAQKMDESRHNLDSIPATSPKPGAFGKEETEE